MRTDEILKKLLEAEKYLLEFRQGFDEETDGAILSDKNFITAGIIISSLRAKAEEEIKQAEERRNAPILCGVCGKDIKEQVRDICRRCGKWICHTWDSAKSNYTCQTISEDDDHCICNKCWNKI